MTRENEGLETSNILLKRIVYISILILITILCIFFFPKWAYALFIIFFIGFSLNEFFSLIQKKNIPVYKRLGILIGLIIPTAIFFNFKLTEEWSLTFILLTFIIFFILQFARKDHSDAILAISTTVFGVIYVSWLGSYLIKLRFLHKGSLLVIFLLLVVKLGDTGAYLVGRKFGRHKLLKRVSPKKSIEGAIGGFIVSVIVAVLSKFYLDGVSIYHLLVLGSLIGISSQLGDLSESLIKRDCNVKDSGNFIPAQGGVLDLMDSILFSAPVAYLYIMVYKLHMVLR